jgi:hypothetical protein
MEQLSSHWMHFRIIEYVNTSQNCQEIPSLIKV